MGWLDARVLPTQVTESAGEDGWGGVGGGVGGRAGQGGVASTKLRKKPVRLPAPLSNRGGEQSSGRWSKPGEEAITWRRRRSRRSIMRLRRGLRGRWG